MSLHPAEEATIRAFMPPARRDRFLNVMASAKGRRKGVDQLNHFGEWIPRFSRSLASSEDPLTVLKTAGAPAQCHVISEDAEFDGHDLPLEEAVERASECYFASLLCCIPGRLALHFGETATPRVIILLRRDVH